MRGDYAPLNIISNLSQKYDQDFPENILLVVDDSHGIGAYGKAGRGTEEYTNAKGVDVLVGTLGKAFGVNVGYVTSGQIIITYPSLYFKNRIVFLQKLKLKKQLKYSLRSKR